MPSEASEESGPVLERARIDLLLSMAGKARVELMKDLLDLFRRENNPRVGELKDALRRGDFPALREITHFMAGSSANLGGNRLARSCKALEKSARDGDGDTIGALLNQVERDYALTLNALQELVAALPSP